MHLIPGREGIKFGMPLPAECLLREQLLCSCGRCLLRAVLMHTLTQGMHVMLGLLWVSCFCTSIWHWCITCLQHHHVLVLHPQNCLVCDADPDAESGPLLGVLRKEWQLDEACLVKRLLCPVQASLME